MTDVFRTQHYLRHNQRRLEHLASLRLPIVDKTVLEAGAGVGDMTGFFLDRGCSVTALEGRRENLAEFRIRHPDIDSYCIDLDAPPHDHDVLRRRYDVLFCYGLLYHLAEPRRMLDAFCPIVDLLLLETCVSPGQADELNPCAELSHVVSQSMHGRGCRPTRYWIYHQLQRHFPFVYTCATQPSHPEFPLNWRTLRKSSQLTRAVFVASREALSNADLVRGVCQEHRRA